MAINQRRHLLSRHPDFFKSNEGMGEDLLRALKLLPSPNSVRFPRLEFFSIFKDIISLTFFEPPRLSMRLHLAGFSLSGPGFLAFMFSVFRI
jgi:hypothetical protein